MSRAGEHWEFTWEKPPKLEARMVELVREFGLPTAMLVVVLIFAGASLRWFAKRVVDPVIPAILELIKHLRDSLDEQKVTHQELKFKMDQGEEDHARILRALEK